ncbi:hypothetical protein PVK06_008681 [Gossypium arboreum]|uniref:Uncharacterized protein n=1 Tax=Gossypium arboreum TaxID=29729 RepID=A0ABR0QLK8_GOSAR|nr:hypothetical protein PVK06_008681 [Gossypium arboreum]
MEVSIRRIKVPITSNAIDEFFELPDFKNEEYSFLMSNIESKNLQEILEELTVPSSKWIVSKQGIHTCCREYLTPLAKDLYWIAGDSVLQQRVEESEDPEEEEEDPTEIELMQSTKIPDKVEPM